MTTPSHGSPGRALARVIDALRDGGHNHQVRGSHVQASCPLHDDKRPSLSIDQRGDRVLFNCFSGRSCTEEEIAEALGLQVNELWDEPAGPCEVCGKLAIPDGLGRYRHTFHDQPGQRRPPTTKASAGRPRLGALPPRLLAAKEVVEHLSVVDSYAHMTLDGEVVAESVRKEGTARREGEEQSYPTKTFRPRYADGRGGWLRFKPAGLVVPIWRLPEIRAAIAEEREVAHAEGHKDAKALLAHGVEATTNITTTFTSDSAEQLRGGRVMVVCDRDLAGYERGLKASDLLAGVAAEVRLVLPAVTRDKADAADHFDAGFSVDHFIPVDRAGLAVLVALAKADKLAGEADHALAEIRARLQADRPNDGSSTDPDELAAAEHTAAAARWAQETGRKLLTLAGLEADLADKAPADVRQRLSVVAARMGAVTVEAHELTGTTLEQDVADLLTPVHVVDEEDTGEDGSESGGGSNDGSVITFPGGAWRPEHSLPSAAPRQEWRYSTQDEHRGVYLFTKLSAADPGRWQLMAVLPLVRPPVVRRDGEGRRLATDYRLAAGPDAAPVTVDHLALHSGGWANILGVPLSDDSKVIAQVGTAIRFEAAKQPETEALVGIDSGSDLLSLPQEAPTGFFDLAPTDADAALEVWREIIAMVTPKMALVLGASAFAPYARSSDVRSHVLSLSGASKQGKSTTLLLAAAVWGNCLSPSALYGPWNVSAQGLPRILGELRVLPAFRDEAGLANLEPAKWAQLIYSVTEGNSRTTPDRSGRYTTTRPWWGILFSTGNGEMTGGLGSGYSQGIPRRVIELSTPFTTSRDAARRIIPEGATSTGLLAQCYGHLGALIAQQVTAGDARARLAAVQEDWPLVCPPNAEELGDYLYAHLAGAQIVDQLLDTHLAAAAAEAAQDVLDRWRAPASEADRALELITDSMDAEPARWPTRDEYVAHLTAPGESGDVKIPYAGVSREVLGVRLDDTADTLWLLSRGWKELAVDGSTLNTRLALEQLEDREVLHRSDEARRQGDYTMAQRFHLGNGQRRAKRVYVLRLAVADGRRRPDPDDGTPEPVVPGSDPGHPPDPVTGSDRPVTGTVTGTVTGANHAVTRSVTGVTGLSDTFSRNVREAEVTASVDPDVLDIDRGIGTYDAPDGTRHSKTYAADFGPCEACGKPCRIVLDGRRIHPPCFDRQTSTPAETWAVLPQRQPCVRCGEPASHSSDGHPLHAGGCNPTTAGDTGGITDPPAPVAASPATAPARPAEVRRFAAPAAVLTGELAHVAGQDPVRWDATHLGELALLTSPDQLRLGWGGGEDRFPDPGQVWLDAAALERLGLPAVVELPDEVAVSDQARRAAIERAFAPLLNLPAVAAAVAAGWQLGRHGLDAWTRLWHPDLLPQGAWLVAIPWERVTDVPLLDGLDPAAPGAAQQLADRLAAWAGAVGVSYRLSPASTGVDLIDHTRPPRRHHDDDRGAGRGRRALVRDEAAELPDFLRRPRDDRFRSVEADFSWWRPWPTLLADERAKPYVAMYDRGKSYLAPWSNIELGLEGLTHRTGDAARWDGSEKPGYWLIDRWSWDAWWLPDPAESGAVSAFVEHNRVWVTSHTLRQLKAQGIQPRVHEAYTWQVTSRYLETASQRIRGALEAGADPAVTGTLKAMYSATVGKFGEREHRLDYHLWRPDWRHHIIANTRTAILHTLRKIHQTNGAAALAVDRDAIAFAVDDPDPRRAWPGPADKLGVGVGQWKPVGVAALAEWGPAHLPKPVRPGQRWRYADAVNALTPPTGGA